MSNFAWHVDVYAPRPRKPPYSKQEASGAAAKKRSVQDTQFEFVNINASSKDSPPTTESPLHAIRSNAARYQWRKQKEAGEHGRKAKLDGGSKRKRSHHSAPVAERDHATKRSTLSASVCTPTSDQQYHLRKGGRHVKDAGATDVAIFPAHFHKNITVVRCYPSDLPISVIAPYLRRLCDRVSVLLPSDDPTQVSPMATEFFQLTISNPVTFHACIWNFMVEDCLSKQAASLEKTNNQIFHRRSNVVDLFCYHRAIHGLRHMISNLSKQELTAVHFDQILLAIAWLGFASSEPAVKPARSGPKQRIDHLQGLHASGQRLGPREPHCEGMKKVVALRGGLGEFSVGVGAVMSMFDTLHATQTLRAPTWPYCPLQETFQRSRIYKLDVKSQRWPSGFRVLESVLTQPLVEMLTKSFAALGACSRAFDDYLQPIASTPEPSMLADIRNHAQHSLMLLPTNIEITEAVQPSFSDTVYQCVRLAASVYSLTTVFPVPYATAPFAKTAVALRKELVQAFDTPPPEALSRLFLWCTVMGALAAIGTRERSWYVKSVTKLARSLKLEEWGKAKVVLEQHLWYANVSDFDGRYLWLESVGES